MREPSETTPSSGRGARFADRRTRDTLRDPFRAARRARVRETSGDILRRVNEAIERLTIAPRHQGTTKLAGRDDYRVGVGDWRIVYEVDDKQRRVVVIRIAHRSDVYRRL